MTKCRICGYPSRNWTPYCDRCRLEREDDIVKYERKLEAHRKYRKGNLIADLNVLRNSEFVYWHDKIYSTGWVFSWPFRQIIKALETGNFIEAIKKENMK